MTVWNLADQWLTTPGALRQGDGTSLKGHHSSKTSHQPGQTFLRIAPQPKPFPTQHPLLPSLHRGWLVLH